MAVGASMAGEGLIPSFQRYYQVVWSRQPRKRQPPPKAASAAKAAAILKRVNGGIIRRGEAVKAVD